MKVWREEFTGKHRGKEEEFSMRALESTDEIEGQLVQCPALMEVIGEKKAS